MRIYLGGKSSSSSYYKDSEEDTNKTLRCVSAKHVSYHGVFAFACQACNLIHRQQFKGYRLSLI